MALTIEYPPAPRHPSVEGRAAPSETAGRLGIWKEPGILIDHGPATAPGNLTVTGTLQLTPAAQTANDHAATIGFVEGRITDVSGGTVLEAPNIPANALFGRKAPATPGPPNTWAEALPLAGGTLTGPLTVPNLTVSGTVTLPTSVSITNLTVTGTVTLPTTAQTINNLTITTGLTLPATIPAGDNQAVHRKYVDDAILALTGRVVLRDEV